MEPIVQRKVKDVEVILPGKGVSMKNYLITTLTTISIIISTFAFASKPGNSEYLDGGDNKSALILAHGKGQYPTWKVVDPLRKGVHKQLAYHTLSLQMPNEDKKWKKYVDDFPEAYEMIREGIRFLKEEKGVTRIVLMGHSMGSRMASAFVSENPGQIKTGLIVAGCRNNGEEPLSCKENLQSVNIPVLDIWGGNNAKDSDAASDREEMVSKNYQQVEVSGANHKFEGYESMFVSSVVNWLKSQK